MEKILITHKDIAEPTRGGVCELYKGLILGLADRGLQVAYTSTKDSWIHDNRIKRILLPRGTDPDMHARNVRQIVEQEQPDIVECSNWRFELVDYAENRSDDNKTKVVVRTDPSARTLFPGIDDSYHEGEQKIFKFADHIVAVSRFTARDIESRYGVEVDEVIYNGVDHGKIDLMLSNTASIPKNEDKKIFWVGRPNNMKGFDILKRVVAVADENWQFMLNCGRSPDDRLIESLQIAHLNTSVVRDLPKDQQLRFMQGSSYFLSTSRDEGFGIAVLESLACGTPVVAYDRCEVLHELYKDSSAMQFFGDNDIETKPLFNKETTSIGRQKARRLSEQYTVDRLVEETIEFYRSITN